MKFRFLMLMLNLLLMATACASYANTTESNLSTDDGDLAPVDEVTEVEETDDDRAYRDEAEEPLAPPPVVEAVDSDGAVTDESDLLMIPDSGGGASSGFADMDTLEGDKVVADALAPAPEFEAQQQSTLKAGEIDDNADWDDYLLYRQDLGDRMGELVNDVDVTGRRIITVTDSDGLPVLGATVTVEIGDTVVSQTRTYADGRTLYFPNAHPDPQTEGDMIVTVEKDGVTSSLNMSLVRMAGPNIDFVLDMAQNRATVKLDVVFLLDATGSMSDEIGQLQDNILSISQQIDDMGDVDVRYGLVHYRDRDDDYVSQVHDFTPDVTAFQADLNRVRAEGGGDTPESLNEGLHDALQTVEWRGADTIKLVFLVADAPPHLDYPDDYDYAEEMLYAGERGIKIHPIASSGLDPIGEYIFRQIGQTTMGRFIFLTYAGGTPGTAGDERPDLEASAQDYTVDFLDGLVVRLIEDEIHAFKGVDSENE